MARQCHWSRKPRPASSVDTSRTWASPCNAYAFVTAKSVPRPSCTDHNPIHQSAIRSAAGQGLVLFRPSPLLIHDGSQVRRQHLLEFIHYQVFPLGRHLGVFAETSKVTLS